VRTSGLWPTGVAQTELELTGVELNRSEDSGSAANCIRTKQILNEHLLEGGLMRNTLALITLTIIAAASICARNAQPQLSDHKKTSTAEIRKELETYIDKLAAEDKFSGAVLVARDGKPIFMKAYGMANKSGNIPNRIDTKFNLGSMNKMFTAVAIAQLAERSKLSFDDPISKHLPDYPSREVANKVTIHHLLTHTSGLGDYQNERFYAQLDKMRTVADLVPLFANDPLSFEPGEKWDYSNAGFVVSGLIIEKASGQSYFEYVKQHIFKPAGMTNTDFYERDTNVLNRAVGYMKVNLKGEPDPEAPRRENRSTRPAKGSPAGGAYSTVNDMFRFRLALLKYRLLNQKYTDIVMREKVKVPAGWPMSEYGYGFAISFVNGKRIVGHGGAGLGIAGKLEMYPELSYTVVILSNYDLPAIMPVVMKTRELILQE
jgi:D-alanyl-D-alanine carboxypeptidase